MQDTLQNTSPSGKYTQKAPSKELFSVISLLFFAPLIRKQLTEEEFWFSDDQKAYILDYTSRGMYILALTGIWILLLILSYVRRLSRIHLASSCAFGIAALLILAGLAKIFLGTSPQSDTNKDTHTQNNTNDWVEMLPETERNHTGMTLRAYIPLLTTRERYKVWSSKALITKEGRLLRSFRIRAGILMPHPAILLGGIILIIFRLTTHIVSGYWYVSSIDKLLHLRHEQPEERAAYPIGYIAQKRAHFRHYTGTSRLAFQERYSQLYPAEKKQTILLVIRIITLIWFATLQLYAHTSARRFSLAVFPYFLLLWRYFIIYHTSHLLPPVPVLQDIGASLAVHQNNEKSPL